MVGSLAAQSDHRFTVYVGDDASNDDIRASCLPFAGLLGIHYHRFKANLGGTDLVGQWSRSVALCSEPWVWMIGDDDELEPGCVAAFHAARAAQPDATLFHFAVRRINANGEVTAEEPQFPPLLTARRFLRARMTFELASYAPDYVFSRAAFLRHGGFQNFPLAWCSDDATWVKLAAETGIRSIDGPRVRWRKSGTNISSQSRSTAKAKTTAHTMYLEWLAEVLPHLPRAADDPNDQELRRLGVRWYFQQDEYVGFRFGLQGALMSARRLSRARFCSWIEAFLRALRADMQNRTAS